MGVFLNHGPRLINYMQLYFFFKSSLAFLKVLYLFYFEWLPCIYTNLNFNEWNEANIQTCFREKKIL